MSRTRTVRLTQRELNRYRKEVDTAADSAGSYVLDAMEAFLHVYPDADTAAMRNLVIEILQTSLPNFCDAAATLSADLFDEIAESLGIDVETQLYDTIDYDKVEQKVRYFAKFLNDGDTERFKREVTDVTRYYVKRSAFENMRENCKGQKIKWARVPSGFETCSFCFMLASRGFVYGSEKLAKIAQRTGDTYHTNCDCIIIPGFEDEYGNPRVKIDGYDPEAMYQNWLKCAETVSVDTSDGVRKWTEDDVKAVMKEVATRDWHWLYTGETPVIKFKPASLEESVSKRPHELETAKRLSENGIKSVFVVDTRKWRDESGQEYSVGLPDLDGGIELKALLKAEGKGAVDGALRDAGRKEGVEICVIDNSWKKLDDDVVRKEIEDRMLRRHIRECLLIRSDGVMIRIKK